ncbi:hypothetical protein IIV31_006L [Armadillidium vulgare iridescent virus]|uniref:Uncharacterized protein n=1 Tax=Armadillidium vulgare iridescent virus TaxID=72201 RepID=A0A068QKM2_9VIRU|nr:hypothetical protein IIV31_006L [Armadillidium vulgare iridescent virus]CCV02378.1 hypothetical protein IIV31_006L [Armadillidium vulgare iridescent virus]
MFDTKLFFIEIDGRQHILECSKDGLNERNKQKVTSLKRTDLLKIAKAYKINTARMYDFEIADRIIEWKPKPGELLCYSRCELAKLTKDEIKIIFKINGLSFQNTYLKKELIDLFLSHQQQYQSLYCYEKLNFDDVTKDQNSFETPASEEVLLI